KKKDIKELGLEEAESYPLRAVRAFKSIYKLFDEAPEFASGDEYAEQVIEKLSEVGITRATAQELTGFGKKGATAQETVVRLLPEMYFMGRATIAFMARGSAGILKGAKEAYDKMRKEQNLPLQDLKKIDEEDFSRVLTELVTAKWAKAKPPRLWGADYVRNLAQKMYLKRTGAIIQEHRKFELGKPIHKALFDAQSKLSAARTAGDKQAIRQANIRINSLREDMHRLTPHLYRSVQFT
ncbi:uncharacterized protein METZ01_LOCUS488541, partial [marine metagenome]